MKRRPYSLVAILFMILMVNACTTNMKREPIIRVNKRVTLKNYEYDYPDYADIPKGTPRPTYNYIDFEQTDSFLDLDTGYQVNDDRADIYLYQMCKNKCVTEFILFEKGKLVNSGFVEPGYEGCQYGLNNFDDAFSDIKPEYYICILTNEGRISQIKVNDLRYEGDLTIIEIGVVTWDPINEMGEK